MSTMGTLLRIARAVVQNVRNIITQQVNLVQEAIYKQIQTMVTNVINGNWKGDGARRFTEEMQQEVLPAINNLTQSFTQHHNSISKAEEVMFQADASAARLASSLVEIYRGIYNG
jgi:WXG100 family type VII secretion target